MTGMEHYALAEMLLLESAEKAKYSTEGEQEAILHRAQVHATLALTAATMAVAMKHVPGNTPAGQWALDILSEK